jgi:UDP-N-acetylmuramoyl-L-alanyl-D-glutamate--2,6-diaminopimelate ligase
MLAQMVGAGCTAAVMEVTSHALVQRRTVGIDFSVAAFTNLTRDHLDYHRSMEQYFEAKRILFLQLGAQATAVVNADDPWGRRLVESGGISADILTYGVAAGVDVRAESVSVGGRGSAFTVRSPWGGAQVETGLLGRYNVSNALAALACAGALDVPLDAAVGALSELALVPGRLEEVRAECGFQVFVDYAHTDDALGHVLRTLREITAGRLIVVFGCGGDRDRSKRPAMGRVAGQLADHAVLTSDNPRSEDPSAIIEEVLAGFPSRGNVEVVENRREAIERALRVADKGDVVLIAGKGHETFQETANKTVPFDDRQVAAAIMAKL